MTTGKYDVAISWAICSSFKDLEKRQECCALENLEECPEYMPPKSSNSGFENLITDSSIFIFSLFILFFIFKFFKSKKFMQMSNFKKGFISAWGIWIFAVISFILLVDPYDSYYGDEELINTLLWCFIPPVFNLVLYLWVKKFLINKGISIAPEIPVDNALRIHQDPINKTTHIEDNKEKWFFQKLARGEFGLVKTFWLYGFTVNLFFGFLVRELDEVRTLIILNIFFVPYNIVYLMGIWNATQLYSGHKIWIYLAKIHVVLGFLFLIVNLIATYKFIYEHFFL